MKTMNHLGEQPDLPDYSTTWELAALLRVSRGTVSGWPDTETVLIPRSGQRQIGHNAQAVEDEEKHPLFDTRKAFR
jgi:hypothetical protein